MPMTAFMLLLALIASPRQQAPDVPGTTVVLQPGERARLQLPASVSPLAGMDPVLTQVPQQVLIRAFVMIELDGWLSVYSENTLPLELSVRR